VNIELGEGEVSDSAQNCVSPNNLILRHLKQACVKLHKNHLRKYVYGLLRIEVHLKLYLCDPAGVE
jgi:hypothetical protein